MKKYLLLALCCLMGLTSAMAQNGLAADGWHEYTVSEGNLSELISETEKYQITKLRLKGKINGDDLRLVRDMAGLPWQFNDDYDNYTDGKLNYLDLSNVIVVDGGYYMHNGTSQVTNNRSRLGGLMFANSKTLLEVALGNDINYIGYSAFSNCTALRKIVCPEVTTFDSGVFSGCTSLIYIDIPKVSYLGTKCFYNCSSLVSIDLPNLEYARTGSSNQLFSGCITLSDVSAPKIKELSSGMFENCMSLDSISFENLKTFNNLTFSGCNNLVYVNFPQVKEVPNGAFDNSELKTIILPNALKIGLGAFEGCSSLESIEFENVQVLGVRSFENCTALKKVSLPNLLEIGTCSFAGCSSLEEICLPKVTKMSEGTYLSYQGRDFANCTSLISVEIPNAEGILGQSAFSGCSSLRHVSLPNIEEIAKSAFYGCKSIETIQLPSVEVLNSYAFQSCTSLKNAHFESVKQIGENCFDNCISLESISAPCAEQIEKNAFYACNSLCSISFPKAKRISEKAFRELPSLKSVFLESIEQIDDFAFELCASLDSVYMPKVKYIGKKVFKASKIKNLYLPEIKKIGNEAFYDSRFEYVEIGETIDTIMESAFYNAENIYIKNKVVPSLLGPLTNVGTTVVPSSSLSAYRSSNSWRDFAVRIIPDDVETEIITEVEAQKSTSGLLNSVGDESLSYATHLTLKGSINSYDIMLIRNKMPNLHYLDLTDVSIKANPYEYYEDCHSENNRIGKNMFFDLQTLFEVKLPNSITYIGESAFSNCSNLRNMTINEGLSNIDKNAFRYCTSLEEILIPSSVISINESAFELCTALKSIYINEGLRTLGKCVFSGCQNLALINLPNSLEVIGEKCFSGCKSLKDINFPINLHTIDPYAFNGCVGWTKIVLPRYLEKIGSYAFSGCFNITELHLSPMIETIGDYAFSNTKPDNIYVYIANAKNIKINQNTFSSWSTSHLHVPKFAYDTYYWDTQWSQFAQLDEFDDKYECFYSKNTITLDKNTGTITGTPDATLHENGGLIVNDEEKQELDEILLKSDGKNGATLIPENSGNITAKKVDITIKVTANKWHFFCFPFDVPLSGMTYEGEYVWRRYDGAKRSRREGGWQNLAAGTTTLEAGRGYIFQGTTTGELTLSVDNPEITASDVKTGLEVHPSDNSQDASWNFVGNPYVSYYSIDATTYSSPITIWNGTGYEAYRPGDDDYMFHPYQAFFVQTPVDASEIGFDATARESFEQSQTSLAAAKVRRAARKMNVNRLLANLELFAAGDTTYMDKTRIVFNDKENMEYDAVSDAAKFMSSERAAEFYTLDSKNVQYAINERPMASGDVRMGFIANKAGAYRIAQSRSDVEMLLVDHQEGITHNLGTGAYTFSSGAGTFDNRFTLKVNGQETGITELKEKTGIDLTVDGELCINGAAEEVTTTVYQLNGVLAGTIQGNGSLRLPKGVYAVKVGLLTLKVQI